MSRLLIVDPGVGFWGSERALLTTVPDLVAAHDRVYAVVPEGAALAPRLGALGVIVLQKPFGLNSLASKLRFVISLTFLCLIRQIDVLYLNQAGLCRLLGPVARLVGRRLVVHVRIAEDLARVARMTTTRRAPVDLILISADMAARYAKIAGRNSDLRSHIAYDAFAVGCASRDLPRDSAAFACVGRITAIKGQRELVDAFAILAGTDATARLDLFGAATQDPAYGSRVERAIRDARLEKCVTMRGYADDAAALLGRYAFVVVPSRYEPLGRVVLEAWDAGCVPICSTGSGGAAEIVSASGGGVLYDGFAPAALADAMRRALALAPAQRHDLVEKGRRWMDAHVSLSAYRHVLSGVLFPTQVTVPPPSGAGLRPESGRNAA